MNWTNNHGVPSPLAAALRTLGEAREYRERVISVTELIGPPMVRQLRRHHAGEAEQDVTDNVFALLGTAVHDVIHKYAPVPDGDHSEKQTEAFINVDGVTWTFTGRFDRLTDGVLLDFKVTSIFAFLLGVKVEWIAQLNLYRHIAWLNNLCDANAPMQIVAVLRDWTKYQYQRDPSRVPASPIMVLDVPQWTTEQIMEYAAVRLAVHAAAEYGDIPPDQYICTPAERWQKPDQFAIFKGTNKRATRVLDTEDAAIQYAVDNGIKDVRIERRKSTPVRCMSYCAYRKWCPYGQCLDALAEDAVADAE